MIHDTSPGEPPVAPEDDEVRSDEFAKALEEFERGAPPAAAAERAADVPVGLKVQARIVSVGNEHVLVDFGGRSEGIAETRHFRNDDGTVRVAPGETVELFVVESADQVVLAPSIRAEARDALRQLREARAAGVPVSGRVTGVNSGGLQVDVGGVRAFCPVSQVEAGFCADPSAYVGRTLEFVVTKVEEGRGGAVLSRRALLRRAEEEKAKALLESLKPGDVREGRVARLEPFGAFVDLGGVDGLVHVSEIRHERIGHPGEALKVGETVRVKVLRIEPGKDGRQRIGLSIRAVAPDPWTEAPARFPVGSRVRGTVARLADFGAFVTLAPGIDGLVHVSQVAHGRIGHVREVLKAGQEVEAIVLGVDPDKKRVSLSIKATLEAPEFPEPAAAAPPPPRAPAAAPVAGTAAGKAAEPELTTMAIALRKAMEEAARRQAKGGRPA